MLFRQLQDNKSRTFTYLLADSGTGEALIIDPVREQSGSYLKLIKELGLALCGVIDTHTHADHITGSSRLAEATGCDIIQGRETLAEGVSRKVADGEQICFGRHRLLAISTPGHTDDSYCFYYDGKDDRRVFTGDTLLIRGTGRTDFQNGDPRRQYHSLFHKLLELPEDTAVYPGHDYKGWMVSTIGEEKEHNPRLQVSSVEEYIELMDHLQLPPPALLKVAVPANLQCGRN